MNDLFFQFATNKVINVKRLIDEYIPMNITFEYDIYSNTHNRVEYRTQDYYMYFQIGKEFGELVSITLLCNKKYNFIKGNISLAELPYNNSTIALKIKDINQLIRRPYLDDGFNYTMTEACKVDVYNDALKISIATMPKPVLCIMNNNFGVLTDIDLNICSFVLKGITPSEYKYLIEHSK
ncbi:MAG: hypothetical protein AB7F19_06330 [Candidatus Babeliales bacterium]